VKVIIDMLPIRKRIATSCGLMACIIAILVCGVAIERNSTSKKAALISQSFNIIFIIFSLLVKMIGIRM
jgi:hypothetical protein